VLGPLTDDLVAALSIPKGPDVPAGVMARQIDGRHWLYLNVSGEPKEIRLRGASRGMLSDQEYAGTFMLPGYEPEFIELK
jgi:beta-galactosidase